MPQEREGEEMEHGRWRERRRQQQEAQRVRRLHTHDRGERQGNELAHISVGFELRDECFLCDTEQCMLAQKDRALTAEKERNELLMHEEGGDYVSSEDMRRPVGHSAPSGRFMPASSQLNASSRPLPLSTLLRHSFEHTRQ